MTSHELSKLLLRISSLKTHPAMNFLQEWVSIEISSDEFIENWLKSKEASLDAFQSFLNLNVDTRKAESFFELFTSLNSFILQLQDIRRVLSELIDFEQFKLKNPIDSLIVSVGDFIQSNESILKRNTYSSTFNLLKTASRLELQIKNLTDLSYTYYILVSNSAPENDFNKSLNLFFNSPIPLLNIIDKLRAVDELYQEIARLLNISTSEYPLELSKIESGSLWLKLFGESRIIKLIADFLESGVSYLHRTYTNEGQIKSIPQQVESVDALLNLRRKLQESGINTATLDENLAHSAAHISSRLNTLLKGEPDVEVNGRKHSVGDDINQKMLEERKGLYLYAADEEHKDEN